MKTFDEVLAIPLGSRWLKGEMPEFDFPGGDSYEGFFRRVNRGLETLLQEGNPRVIAVLHGAVISAIMEILFSGEKKNIFDWTPSPGCGYEIHIKNGMATEHLEIAAEHEA